MEEARAVPMVVVMDLVVEVVDMVAADCKNRRKGLQFLAGERARSCQESEDHVTLRQWSQMR